MIKDLDTVVLTEDLPEHGLKRGDLGLTCLHNFEVGWEYSRSCISQQNR